MIKKIFYGILTTGIRTLSGIIRNKIFATVLSINLFGILSIGIQSSGLLYTFIAFGIPLGVVTYSAGLVNEGVEGRKRSISRIAVLASAVAAGVFVIILAAVLLDAPLISRLVTANAAYALPTAILLLATPLMIVENSLYSVMEGMGRLREIVIFKVVPSVVIIPVLYWLTTRYLLTGAAMSMVVFEIFLCATGLWVLRRDLEFGASSFRVGEVLRGVVTVAALSFTMGTLRLAADFAVKRYVLGVMGEVDNGIVQSIAKVTDLYPLVSLSWLSMHLFPSIAAQKEDAAAMARILERTTVIAIALIIPVILILFAFRATVLELMFHKEFVVGEAYFGAMLASGVVKIYAWVLGVGLLAAGFKRQWFICSMIMTVFYLAGSWAGFASGMGIYSLPLTVGIGLVLQSVYCYGAFRTKGISFTGEFEVQSAMFVVMTLLLAGALLSAWFLAAAAALFVWFLYRYRLMHEMRNRITELLPKLAS